MIIGQGTYFVFQSALASAMMVLLHEVLGWPTLQYIYPYIYIYIYIYIRICHLLFPPCIEVPAEAAVNKKLNNYHDGPCDQQGLRLKEIIFTIKGLRFILKDSTLDFQTSPSENLSSL